MKLCWEVISSSDKLWVKVFYLKYGLESSNLPISLPDKPGSWIWTTIRSTWSATVHGAHWSICNGARIHFWLDCWVTKSNPLISLALQLIPQDFINATVNEFTNGHGGWNWSRFEHLLPNYTLMQIASIMPHTLHLEDDKIFWGLILEACSRFDQLMNLFADHDRTWSLPWTWKGPQSIRLFLWQLLHGKLKTHEELARHHIPVHVGCDRCGGVVEDILHALRDCSCIKQA